MFVDKVQIKVKAGNGGDGITSFYRDKLVSLGGPDGGDGGNGGNIVFICDGQKNTLLDFYYTKKFFASNGEKGMKKNCNGKKGEDLVIPVPVGTIIADAESKKIIGDFNVDGKKMVLLHGGKGGRGNSKFATSTRQSPGFCELGEKTKEFSLSLELKTIADVGLIGFPNTGKSTLLSVISDAKPKIANYHFTTLYPNLGVVKHYENSFVVADIPGLIEGASEGVGLGHNFLKHVERTRMLINVIDAAGLDGRDPLQDYFTINTELSKYSKKLTTLPQIIALNKIDVCENIDEVIKKFKSRKETKDIEIFNISAATNKGIKELMDRAVQILATLPKQQEILPEIDILDPKDTTSFNVVKVSTDKFIVVGGYVDNLVRSIVLSDTESFAYFQRRLKDDGIIDALKQKGAKNGAIVQIADAEFEMED